VCKGLHSTLCDQPEEHEVKYSAVGSTVVKLRRSFGTTFRIDVVCVCDKQIQYLEFRELRAHPHPNRLFRRTPAAPSHAHRISENHVLTDTATLLVPEPPDFRLVQLDVKIQVSITLVLPGRSISNFTYHYNLHE